jgi:gamma-D-glutamyl-L-lysine dipeptidyl-peptidase
MNYGISGLSLIPVRKEPSEKSEMITQVLFGEHFEIIDYLPGWQHIRLAYDGYEGWIDHKMATPVKPRVFNRLQAKRYAVTTDIFSLVPVSKEQNLMLVAGSTLPQWHPNLRHFTLDDKVMKIQGNVSYRKHRNVRQFMISQAMKYFNAPYLWGGRSPFGIDCSGFTQIIYKMAGIPIPRDADQQVLSGNHLSFIEETQPGDLAFFDDENGRIVHVGILWERNKIIHASGKVRIDNVDQFGIFNVDTRCYTHKLRVIKKIISDAAYV